MTEEEIPLGKLYDSCVVIDALNGAEFATQLIARDPARCISAVSRAEVLSGNVSPAQRLAAIQLMDRFRTLNLDSGLADIAGRVRRETNLKLPDAIIAATAVQFNLQLVTRDCALAAKIPNVVLYQLAEQE